MHQTLIAWGLSLGLLLAGFSVGYAQDAGAPEIHMTMTLQGQVPPISEALAGFIVTAGGMTSTPVSPHLVGFGGADLGRGPGNGADESIPVSFTYPPFASISAAWLTLTLTPRDRLVSTDALVILEAPQTSRLDRVYGNDVLRGLAVGVATTVQFDLTNLEVNRNRTVPGGLEVIGRMDLTPALVNGQLNMIYQDDALLHTATLTLTGTPAPVDFFLSPE